MRFSLIDRVIEFDEGRRIVAVKAVSLAEEYLSEHFPTFPVLPGVFMLEAMVQAARWLIYQAQDFASSLILLESARGVTYKSFVAPGHLLRVEVLCRDASEVSSRFTGAGYCGDEQVVKGRFELRHENLASRHPTMAAADELIIKMARQRWALLCGNSVPGTADG